MKSLLFGAIFVLLAACLFAEEPKKEEPAEYIGPFSIVGFPTTASPKHRAAAKKLADALKIKWIQESKGNPVCCVWIEINGWIPNPGVPGYVIINQAGGSRITASDEDALEEAIARYIGSIRETDGIVKIPQGLLTSYKVVAESTDRPK